MAETPVARAVAALEAGLPAQGWSDVYVSRKRPGIAAGYTSLPHSWVRVTRSGGGGMPDLITLSVQLLVECWDDLGRCEELADAAVVVLGNIAGERESGGRFVRQSTCTNGPVEYPDPLVTSHDRYQFTQEMLFAAN